MLLADNLILTRGGEGQLQKHAVGRRYAWTTPASRSTSRQR